KVQYANISVLKAPSVNLEDDRPALERFVLEGWICQRLRNAHLLRALPVPDNPCALYQRLEYVDGVTLQTWLEGHPDASVEERLYLADQLLNGVRALHRADVIHGDLKPDNVMVDRNGHVRIIDFGSCLCRGMELTTGDIPLGTRHYSAPEVAAGGRPSEQSDLFSSAVIIHQLLTGALPWQGRYDRASQQPLPPLQSRNPFVPLWVNSVLQLGLQRQPGQRFRDAAEFREALRRPLHQDSPLPNNQVRQLRIWKGACVLLTLLLLISLAVK
ncbi:MAG: serine/threonine-protein kinase, partial [Alcanivorax sp.]|nr:serine/threonine-protein kinase [Alcanivorax sp.]